MLFEQEQPKDQSQIEELNITSIYLYFSDADARQFKQMCKVGMRKMGPDNFQQSNISDFIFALVKQYTNGSDNL